MYEIFYFVRRIDDACEMGTLMVLDVGVSSLTERYVNTWACGEH